MSVYFRLEESAILDKLAHPDLSNNVVFTFDKPLQLNTTDLLEVSDAAVYLLSQGIRIFISGKWDRWKDQ